MRFDPDEPRYTTTQAGDAAGVRATTLKNWLFGAQAVIPLDDDEVSRPAKAQGIRHLLSLRRVFQIALMAELVPAMSLTRASVAALHVTDVGELNDLQGRVAGDLYNIEENADLMTAVANCTVLVVPVEGDVDVVRVSELQFTYDKIRRQNPGRHIVLVPCNEIYNRVCVRLGLLAADPAD